MPEGPSIVILKELVHDLHLENTEITGVAGNTTTIDKERLLHQKVKAFKSWGKHFLVCFETFTLRIHLMLFGSYRINERKDTPVRLSLVFNNAELNFYTCSVKIMEGTAEELYDWSTDVLSDQWDAKAAVKKLKLKPTALVCDLLLDQNIFSGVGNIIKNEVLYRIKVHPLSIPASLPATRLNMLVKEARQYSFDFLEWKKAFVLRQHWLVYNKSKCPLGHPITRQYLGKTNRRTFFCEQCQKLYTDSPDETKLF